jgi:DNA replication protein DnaC
MERIDEILKKIKTRTDLSKESTDIWSSDKADDDTVDTNPCPICKGARFVYPLAASGIPDYSRVVPCTCTVNTTSKKRSEQLLRFSNLGDLSNLTFDTLNPEGRKVNGRSVYEFKDVYETVRKYADEPKGWLILIGLAGSGKTHLACAIANYRVGNSKPAFYITAADLLDHLRSTFHPDSNIEYDELFEQIKNVPLLIIDDLTVSISSSWAKSKLEQLLNHRFNTRLPTVLTTDEPVLAVDDSLGWHLNDPDFSRIVSITRKTSMLVHHIDGLEYELIKAMTFNSFDFKRLDLPLEIRQNLEQAYRNASDFAQSPQGWLVFSGNNGCGKTHLAASIANYLQSKGKPVIFLVVPDLLDYLRSAYNPESKVSYDELFESVKTAPILILDDFGEQSTTPWAQEKLYQLINYRYNSRLATVITTCFSLDEIESRIGSRLVDPSISLVFNIIAPDYRGDRKTIGTKKLRPKKNIQSNSV